MNYRREGLLLPELTSVPLDDQLYAGFLKAHGEAAEVYKHLALDTERKQLVGEAWRHGEDASLSASHIDVVSLETQLDNLHDWKAELLQTSIDPTIKDAYRWRVNEDIANLRMIQASNMENMSAFHHWNNFIYGAPDPAIYAGALDKVAHDAETLLAENQLHSTAATAAESVLAMLEGKRGYRELIIPTEETFQAVRDDHYRAGGYYALLLAGVEVPETGKINREVGDPILQHVIDNNLQSDYRIGDAEAASWGVPHSIKAVERPASYNMPWRRFIGLGLGHEMGSHLLEKVNGTRGPVALMSHGLDRYEAGNEGRAVMREQVVYPTFEEFAKQVRWRDIARRHIAISYAMGVGEEGLKSSAEVYRFVNTIDRMYQTKLTPDDANLIDEKAHAKTVNLLTRVLKGTDGTGGAYLKDKVYLEGHVASWLTAATHGPDSVSQGDLGKFDINNPRHIAKLRAWGLLPDEEAQ